MRADLDLAAVLERPVAHRGLHDESRGVIENSMAAARAAIAAGFGIECDVQMSSDGEAMVFHDETLDRLTTETGPVSGWPAAELTSIALKHGDGAGIPALDAFLGLVAGRVPVVIEIKGGGKDDKRLTARTVALAARYRGPLALKSFDPALIDDCRKLGARCPLGLVGPAETIGAAPPSASYDFLSWNIDVLRDIRGVYPGMPLMSWTVRSREQQAAAVLLRAQIVFESFIPKANEGLESG